MKIKPTLLVVHAAIIAVVTFGGGAAAADAPATDAPATRIPDAVHGRLHAALAVMRDDALERLQPLPEGEEKTLRAVVMETEGRAQWRADAESAWKAAKVDDVLDAGAMIRTGRRSSLVLRVGQNASVIVDRNSRVVLPQLVQAGETLRTTIEVTRGRADFKVDRVGLTNDFSVVTPSTTLSVRGTGFAVDYGGLEGTRVTAARLNEMHAIEVRYFLARFAFFLSGQAIGSDAHPNPALAELFKSFGPPRLVSGIIEAEATPELLSQTLANPVRRERDADLAYQQFARTLGNPPLRRDLDLQGMGYTMQFGSFAQISQIICDCLDQIFATYAIALTCDGLGTNELDKLRSKIDEVLAAAGGSFEDDDLNKILVNVVKYCEVQHEGNDAAIDRCVADFFTAFSITFFGKP